MGLLLATQAKSITAEHHKEKAFFATWPTGYVEKNVRDQLVKIKERAEAGHDSLEIRLIGSGVDLQGMIDCFKALGFNAGNLADDPRGIKVSW